MTTDLAAILREHVTLQEFGGNHSPIGGPMARQLWIADARRAACNP